MEIRQANTSDAKLISNLAHEIWPCCFKGILTTEQINNLLEHIYNPKSLIYEMEKLGHVFWVAYLDSIEVGYVSAYIENKTTWIKKLYILPDMQGKGCGKALMNEPIKHFPRPENISLLVHRDNISAQEFYKHLGFSIVREKPVKMGDYNFTDFVMSKPL